MTVVDVLLNALTIAPFVMLVVMPVWIVAEHIQKAKALDRWYAALKHEREEIDMAYERDRMMR